VVHSWRRSACDGALACKELGGLGRVLCGGPNL
jgi:hypothetical protein